MVVKFLNRNIQILFIIGLILLTWFMSLFDDNQMFIILHICRIIFIISLFFVIRRLFFFYKKNFKGKILSSKTKIDIVLMHIALLFISCFLFYNLFFKHNIGDFIIQPLTAFTVSGFILIFTFLFVGIYIFSSNKFAQGMSNEEVTNTVRTILPQKKINIIDDISQFISDLIDLSLYLYLVKIKKEYTEANLIKNNWKNSRSSNINEGLKSDVAYQTQHIEKQNSISENEAVLCDIFPRVITLTIHNLLSKSLFEKIDEESFHKAIHGKTYRIKVLEGQINRVYRLVYRMSEIIKEKKERREWERMILSKIIFDENDTHDRFEIYKRKKQQEDKMIDDVFDKNSQILSNSITATISSQ